MQESAERVYASQEPRLRFRLPPNLETLTFSLSQAQGTISLEHLEDLIRMRVGSLPNLQTLQIYYSRYDKLHRKKLRDLLVSLVSYLHVGRRPLQVTVGPLYLKSVFDNRDFEKGQPGARWGGGKYSHALGVRLWMGVWKTSKRHEGGYC
jgi:hypothetical protein